MADMTKLDMSVQSMVIDKFNNIAFAQVGWLGGTGRVYGLHENPASTQKGSFTPLYIQVGHWEQSENDGEWMVQD